MKPEEVYQELVRLEGEMTKLFLEMLDLLRQLIGIDETSLTSDQLREMISEKQGAIDQRRNKQREILENYS